MNELYEQISCSRYMPFFLLPTAFFRLPSQRFFLADPKNWRKRPDSHESVAAAVGVLDFPRKSFVQIIRQVFLSFSLLVRNILRKKGTTNPPHLRAALNDFADSRKCIICRKMSRETGQWLLPKTVSNSSWVRPRLTLMKSLTTKRRIISVLF